MLDVAFARPRLPRSGSVALLIGERAGASGVHETLEQATDGAIDRAIRAAAFSGRVGESTRILAPGAGLAQVIAVGLGKTAERTRLGAEQAGGIAATLLADTPAGVLVADALSPELAAAAAHGATLRSYRFDNYHTRAYDKRRMRLGKLTVLTEDPFRARTAYDAMRDLARGVLLARDLVSEPANVLTPREMAARCRALAPLGLEVEVLGSDELDALGFGALLSVGRGSANEPCVAVLQWHGGGHAGKQKPLAFVGKGVTFDSGGISLAGAGGAENTKWDMAGAAAVVGLMSTLARRRARLDAVGVLGLAENMPSGSAQRPGDVIRTASGETVEVLSTDAEGRLILADVLWYCQSRFDPLLIVDLATLTGAIVVSLGHERAGLFSNDERLAARLLKAGDQSGERLWRMPLEENCRRQLDSDIADLRNAAGKAGAAIIAAEFLHHFVHGRPWAHLDIAGVAWTNKNTVLAPKGATAFGVRLLDRFIASGYEA